MIDEETLDLIKKSILYYIETNGYFDITTSNLNKIWKNTIKTKTLPDLKIIKKELKNVGTNKIKFKDNQIKLYKSQNIDLGGIAKGYILDKIVKIINYKKIKKGIINLGGAIHVIGSDSVGIRNPFKPMTEEINDDYILKVNLTNENIVTSGIYEQEYRLNGISYNHIIDPKTGFPCNNKLLSVSLIGKEGAQLDAYATAIFNMSLNNTLKLLKENDIEAIFIFKDGNIFITEKTKNKIEKEMIK